MNITTFINLVTDCSRRDLTINAIARDTDDNTLIDPFGGQQDIENKHLRHVSKAFAEDPVRVLRIARFNARFGSEWKISHDTKCLIAEMVDDGLLEELTPERVWKETEKALSSDNPMLFFDVLYEVGALCEIFPQMKNVVIDDLDDCFKTWSFDMTTITDSKVNFALWAHLMMKNGIDVNEFIENFKVPNDFSKMVDIIKLLHPLIMTFNDALPDLMNLFNVSFLDYELLSKTLSILVGDNDLTDMILNAKTIYDSVNFDSIDDEDKKWLKGPQIGSEINRIRAEKISELLN